MLLLLAFLGKPTVNTTVERTVISLDVNSVMNGNLLTLYCSEGKKNVVLSLLAYTKHVVGLLM